MSCSSLIELYSGWCRSTVALRAVEVTASAQNESFMALCSVRLMYVCALFSTMSECRNPPPALAGMLRLYQTYPVALPYFETHGEHVNKLIFVPGLTDTLGVVPYLPRLAEVLDKLGYSLVQCVKSSDLGGFGTSSLEGDAQEIAQLVEHLVKRADHPCTGKLVLMGHSTGCQDVVTFLSRDRSLSAAAPDVPIHVHGGILQAPVSDREYFNTHDGKDAAGARRLAESEVLVHEGKSSTLLARDVPPMLMSQCGRGAGNSGAVLSPAFTAYRFRSLNGRGGDDDFFSSDLSDEEIRRALQPALSRAPLLMLMGEKEYVSYLPRKLTSVSFWRLTSTGHSLPSDGRSSWVRSCAQCSCPMPTIRWMMQPRRKRCATQ